MNRFCSENLAQGLSCKTLIVSAKIPTTEREGAFQNKLDMTMQILAPQWLLCLDHSTEVLTDHAVAIEGDTIVSIAPRKTLKQAHPKVDWIELPKQVLMPGLINCHTHAAMNLLRGAADDMALHDWLQKRIWPLEGELADAEFVYDGTVLAVAEMLLGGTTTFNDMYFYPEQSAKAAMDLGARIFAGMTVIEFPTRYANDPSQYIELGMKAKQQFAHAPTVHWTIAPHAPYTVCDATFTQIAELAETHDLPIHCHLHETASEVSDAVCRDGIRPFERLKKLGLINPRFLAIHGVHLNDEELAHMAQVGATLVHCPSSNMKLASGFAPTAKALKAGVNVVIGTDGAASNNKLDLWEEARLASLLSKGHSGDATAWPAGDLLHSITNRAAKALRVEHLIGRIAQGLKADLISIQMDTLVHQVPNHNLVSKLAYSGSARDVYNVWVNGLQVVQSQQLVGRAAQLVQEIMRKTEGVWQTRVEKVG